MSEWTTKGISAHEIKQIYRPKGWSNATYKYDLAIIVLKTPITFNKNVQPIQIDTGHPDTKALEGLFRSIPIFFSQIYHCEPPSSRKHSTVVRHSGTIVPFLAELSRTPNKIRAFFPTVTSHTHTNILTDIFEFMTHYDGNMGKSKKFT